MKKYQYILFDLDGTLTESEPGIFASIRYALSFFNITNEPDEKLRRMIGPPLNQSFAEMYGFDEKQTAYAMEKYRERYTDKGIFENAVYNGIPELLDNLQKAGKVLMLATSKPAVFAERILKHYELEKYFSFVSAGDLSQKHSEKEDIIRKALNDNNITDLSRVIMIGDRFFDINGANRCGIDSVGVLYGYGDRGELEDAGATFIAKKVQNIYDILI